METILDVARQRDVAVIEDNAHGFFGKYNGQLLGTFGRFATLSFHETKNISCGEGGALLLNQPDDLIRAEILHEKGTDRARFFRGEVDKYSWVDVGSSLIVISFSQEAKDSVEQVYTDKGYRIELIDGETLAGFLVELGFPRR